MRPINADVSCRFGGQEAPGSGKTERDICLDPFGGENLDGFESPAVNGI